MSEIRIIGGVSCSVLGEDVGNPFDNSLVRRVTIEATTQQRRSIVEMSLTDMKTAGLTDNDLANAAASSLQNLMTK